MPETSVAPASPTGLPCPRVACVLVHWKNWPDTSACLEALARQSYPSLQVIVVDNASGDGSLEMLCAAHPWAHFVANETNVGFPKACNIGARDPRAVGAEFVWFLNNDTIPPPETACRLVDAAVRHPRAGVIGAVLYFAEEPDRVQAWGGGSVSRWTAFNRHYFVRTPLEADSYITFASAFVRRIVYDQVGGLFEGAFMYFEDSDFCLRARAAGWELMVAADTAILHREGGSLKVGSPGVDRMVTTAGLLFLGRHAPVPALALLLYLGSRVAKRLLRLDWSGIAAVLAGVRDWRLSRRAV